MVSVSPRTAAEDLKRNVVTYGDSANICDADWDLPDAGQKISDRLRGRLHQIVWRADGNTNLRRDLTTVKFDHRANQQRVESGWQRSEEFSTVDIGDVGSVEVSKRGTIVNVFDDTGQNKVIVEGVVHNREKAMKILSAAKIYDYISGGNDTQLTAPSRGKRDYPENALRHELNLARAPALSRHFPRADVKVLGNNEVELVVPLLDCGYGGLDTEAQSADDLIDAWLEDHPRVVIDKKDIQWPREGPQKDCCVCILSLAA